MGNSGKETLKTKHEGAKDMTDMDGESLSHTTDLKYQDLLDNPIKNSVFTDDPYNCPRTEPASESCQSVSSPLKKRKMKFIVPTLPSFSFCLYHFSVL